MGSRTAAERRRFLLKSDDYDKTEDLYFTKTLAEAGFFVVLDIENQESRSG